MRKAILFLFAVASAFAQAPTYIPEGTAPAGAPRAGYGVCWFDNVAHAYMCENSSGVIANPSPVLSGAASPAGTCPVAGALYVAGTTGAYSFYLCPAAGGTWQGAGGTFTLPTASDTVKGGVTMSTPTSSVAVATDDARNSNARLPSAGTTLVAQKFFGTSAPGSVATNLPGDLYTDTTHHQEYVCNAPSGTAAPACTAVATAGWLLLNANGIPIVAFNPNTATALTCPGTAGAQFVASTTLTGAHSIPTVSCTPATGTAVQVQVVLTQGATPYALTLPSPFSIWDFTQAPASDTMTCSGTYDGTNLVNSSCSLANGSGNVMTWYDLPYLPAVTAATPGRWYRNYAASAQNYCPVLGESAGGTATAYCMVNHAGTGYDAHIVADANGNVAIPSTLLGTTPTDGLTLPNTTPATNGNQQISPATEWIGQGWAIGTGLSTPVGFRSYVVPVQGTDTSASYYGLFYHPPSGGDVLGLSMLPSGKVGIGTTGPSTLLHLYGSAPTLRIQDSGSSAYMDLTGTNPGTIQVIQGDLSLYIVNSGYALKFFTASVERMRIDSSGNVGIGTTTPASKLNIDTAPVATANYATLSIGSGAWDGTTTGYFVGSSSGTSIGANEVSGYGGNLLDVQVAGVSKAKVSAAGILTLSGSTFVLGATHAALWRQF
jgi:hypothetical protein